MVLVVAAAQLFPDPVTDALLAGALALLGWSFGRTVLLLWQAARADRPMPPAD